MRSYLYTYLPYLFPAVLLVALQSLVAGFGITTQLVLLGIALATTGIPHGALDYLIFQHQEKSAGRKHSLLRFLACYLGLMAFYALLWWFSPSFSLVIFLLLSAWHFADNDLAALPLHKFSDNLIRIAFGSWLLLVLLFGNTTELIPALQHIVGGDAFLLRFAQWFEPLAAAVFWFGLLGWPLILRLRMHPHKLPVEQWYPLFTLLLLLVLCRTLPMILSFAVYFAVWHSLRSFRSIWLYLCSQDNGFHSAKQLVLPALPFVLGAFTGLAGFFFWSNAVQASLAPLWIFLSLITLPHGLLMHDVYERSGKLPEGNALEEAALP